jgi:type III pantothenate kinase
VQAADEARRTPGPASQTAMTLLLDLGNTRLKATFLRDGAPHDVAGFPLADAGLEAAFGHWLGGARPAHAWLAAVAPDAAVERIAALLEAHGIAATRVRTQSEALGVRIAYAEPARLGVDRWLNLIAARRRIAGPVLVASVGTALTVDALLADGTHLGGLIAAPPEAARAAVVARAPRLDVARGEVARFARSTEDAIESGATLAATALIERSLHELERIAGTPAALLLTGGGAAPLRPWLTAHEAVDDLVLYGLAAWAAQASR